MSTSRTGGCACGSPLAAKAELIPHIQGVSAASFDDASDLRLIANIRIDSLRAWNQISPELPRIGGTPTGPDLLMQAQLMHPATRTIEHDHLQE